MKQQPLDPMPTDQSQLRTLPASETKYSLQERLDNLSHWQIQMLAVTLTAMILIAFALLVNFVASTF